MGSRSYGNCSTKSILPPSRALAVVRASGMTFHSTRSMWTALPPARPLAGSWRGT
ncbi:Uncharacterised protein [Bordetella pertussis]|nr:Uncharacterised protein [Bordetella pertussis]